MTIYIGIDWSQEKHDVVMTNKKGGILARMTIDHSVAGFQRIDRQRAELGVEPEACVVGIESHRNILLDFLQRHGYSQIYIIPPHLTAASRGRLSANQAHTDQSDGALLAELLRTDRHRLQAWRKPSLLMQQLQHQVDWHHQQKKRIRQMENQLQALLRQYYPAALNLFSGLRTQISLAFIGQYPDPREAAALDFEAFAAFSRREGYSCPASLPKQFARFQQPVPQATGETIATCQTHGQMLALELLSLVKQHSQSQRRLTALFEQHADAPIFRSFPGAGKWLAPALLAKFGEDRHRFPTAASLQALAGTCPVTKSSGKSKQVLFRQGCDKNFRQIAQQWARSSVPQSPWAYTYFQRHVTAGRKENDSYRRLANRWLAIAWKCWQTHRPYDQAYHWQQCLARREPRR